MLEIGTNMVKGIWNGISDVTGWIIDKIKGFCGGIIDKVKEYFGIHSPSTVFRDEVGKYLAQGLGEGFSDEMENVSEKMQDAIPRDFDMSTNLKYNNGLKRSIAENIVWNSDNINTMPTAYSITPGNQIPNAMGFIYNQNNNEDIGYLIQTLIDILLAYFPQFAKLMEREIVFEDGTVAGHLTPIIDKNLSDEETKRRRGN